MKVFLSYEWSDQAAAQEILSELGGIRVFAEMNDLQSTTRLIEANERYDAVVQQLIEYDRAIILFSHAYLQSPWLMETELQALKNHENKVRERVRPLLQPGERPPEVLFPLRLGSCEIGDVHFAERLIDLNPSGPSRLDRRKFELLRRRLFRDFQAFVIMRLGDKELDAVYQQYIKPVCRDFGYSVTRVDEVRSGEKIDDQLIEGIARSQLILADLTGERPNCYFEAGYAKGLRKEVVFTIREPEEPHFDVKGYRFIRWKTPEQLEHELRLRLESIRAGRAAVRRRKRQSTAGSDEKGSPDAARRTRQLGRQTAQASSDFGDPHRRS